MPAERLAKGRPEVVEKFQVALRHLAAAFRQEPWQPDVELIGIYAAWRGGSLTPGAIKWATYWRRRSRARTVGRADFFEFLVNAIAATKDESHPGRMFLVGHSFGSRVLEAAIDQMDFTREQPRSERALQAQTKLATAMAPDDPRRVPPVDLILYVNAATPSTLTRKMIAHLRQREFAFLHPDYDAEFCEGPAHADDPRCRKYPLFAAITSTGDAATRFLLPTANLVLPPLPLSVNLRSAANTGGLRTHDARSIACPNGELQSDPRGPRELCFESKNGCRECFELIRKEPVKGNSAFWIFRVTPSVIKDHGDIWNESLLALVQGLLRPSGSLRVDQQRKVTIERRVYSVN